MTPAVTEVDGTPQRLTFMANASSSGSRQPPPPRTRPATPGRRPPPQVDAEGFKLADKPAAKWDEMVSELRSWYADKGVHSREQFESKYDRTCPLCPTEWHNMPHREKHCPSMNAGFTSGIARLGKANAARVLARALARSSSVSVVSVMQAAAVLDATHGDGVLDACEYFCDWADDDLTEEEAFLQHDAK